MDTGANGVIATVEHGLQAGVSNDELLAGSELVVTLGSLGFFQVVFAIVEADDGDMAMW